jgi:hypothetical protein
MMYELQFLKALCLTVVIETACLFFIVRVILKIDKHQAPDSLLVFLGIFCSSATVPYLWFILPLFIKTALVYNIVGEVGVVILEAIIYFFVLKIGIKRSLVVSLLCNSISFLAGCIVAYPGR